MRLLSKLEEEQLELIKQAVRQGGEAITPEDERFLRNASKDIIKEIINDVLSGRLDDIALEANAKEFTQAVYGAFYKAYDQLVKAKAAQAYAAANRASLTTKGGIRGLVKAWFNRISIAQEQAVNATNRMWSDAFSKVRTSGGTAINPDEVFAAERLFLNELGGGNALRKYLQKNHGIDDFDRQIFRTVLEGHHTVPVLNYIGKAAVLQQQMLDNYVAKIDPHYTPPVNLAGSIKIDQVKLHKMGMAGFVEDMWSRGLYKQLPEYKRLASNPRNKEKGVPDKEIKRILEELYIDAATTGKLNTRDKSRYSVLQSATKRFEFDNVESEWEFIETYGMLHNGALAGVVGSRQARTGKMAADSILGSDWGATLQAFSKAVADNTNAADGKYVEDFVQARGAFLDGVLDGGSYDETFDHVIKGTEQFVTATFTGAALLRNLLIDNAMYTATVRSSFQKTSALWDYFNNFNKMLVGMVDTGRVQEIADLIEFHSMSATMSQKQVVEGVANSLVIGSRRGAEWAKKFTRGMNWFSDAFSKVSGADRGNRAARTMAAMQFGHAVQETLKRPWSELDQRMRQFYLKYGIGEKEFEILKTAKTVDDPRTGIPFLIDIHALLDDSFRVHRMRGANETSLQARVRLRNSVIALMEDGVSEYVPKVQSSDIFSFTKQTNPLSKLVTSAVYRFGPITMRQYHGTVRAIRRMSGLDDADASIGGLAEAATRDPVAFAKVLSLMSLSGVIGVWAYDIKNGKTPRDLSPLTIWEGLNFSGASGALGMIYMSLVYNQAILSSPHNSIGMSLVDFAKAMADIENPDYTGKLSRQAKRLILRMGGFTNLWYTKAITDKLINEALNIETTPSEIRRLEERGQEKFLD